MLDSSRRRRGVRRYLAPLARLTFAAVVVGTALPRTAEAMCCACTACTNGGFCVDGVADGVACATLCMSSGCLSTNFGNADICDGGCNGATPQATVTASATATGSVPLTPTATATATVTASATATNTAALSGRIGYYSNDEPVADVEVLLTGTAAALVMTDENGEYAFSAVGPGAHKVQPEKDGDFNVAVTALDANRVLQYVAGIMPPPPLTADQRLAADVTGNGAVTALDATRILQFQAGIITKFLAAVTCQSDWLFVPDPTIVTGQMLVEPLLSTGMCRMGAIMYDGNFMPPATGQDFRAILIGDVTGNWAPATPTPES